MLRECDHVRIRHQHGMLFIYTTNAFFHTITNCTMWGKYWRRIKDTVVKKRKLRLHASMLPKSIPGLYLTFQHIFPDFPWPHDTHLMSIMWNPEQSEEMFCICNHWVFTEICLEIRGKHWVTSARSLILKFPDFPEEKNFLDFPWFFLMLGTLIRVCLIRGHLNYPKSITQL